MPEISKSLTCLYCDQTFNSRATASRHRAICKIQTEKQKQELEEQKKIENEKEEELIEKLKNVLPEKDILRNLDTLIGTQRVRRIGPEILQNNQSHTELPDLPEHLKSLLEKI